MFEKISHMIVLKDAYGPLLTRKQLDIFNLYYEDDLSFAEIAEEMQISRQAVYDLIKRTEKILAEYEDKLGLVKKMTDTRECLEEVYDLINLEHSDKKTVLDKIGLLIESL